MKAAQLFLQMDADFIKPGLSDEWPEVIEEFGDLVSESYKKLFMGVVFDFAEEIEKAYTAVFPSAKVLNELLDRNEQNILLFVHHPMIWDIRQAPKVFANMDRELVEKLKQNKISIYNLHVPLDNYGPYATSTSLAKALGLEPEKGFAQYFGGLSGAVCRTDLRTVSELKAVYEKAVGHEIRLYMYGDEIIKGQKVAVVGGGGNAVEHLEEVENEDINTFVTGITLNNDHSKKAHDYAQQHKINILGGTHYSTEKFACIALCEYFRKLGLPSEFIPDIPVMEDI